MKLKPKGQYSMPELAAARSHDPFHKGTIMLRGRNAIAYVRPHVPPNHYNPDPFQWAVLIWHPVLKSQLYLVVNTEMFPKELEAHEWDSEIVGNNLDVMIAVLKQFSIRELIDRAEKYQKTRLKDVTNETALPHTAPDNSDTNSELTSGDMFPDMLE